MCASNLHYYYRIVQVLHTLQADYVPPCIAYEAALIQVDSATLRTNMHNERQ
jgi:hypothetical protein